VKNFLSCRNDFFRQSYRADPDDHPRQCVFVGSTNDLTYLRDDTGNRRFWPVKIGRFDVDALAEAREQLWAEALARYRGGEPWHLTPGLEVAAGEEQELRRVGDSWEDVVGVYLADLVTRAAGRGWPSVSVTEVLRDGLGVPVERHDQIPQNRVVRILAMNGWVKHRTRAGSEDGEPKKRYWLEQKP
jgi:predicted P-loop ATPase